MAAATSLPEAAGQSFDNLFALWISNTLKAKLTAFWVELLPTFPESEVGTHPVSNWLVLISALADQMPSGGAPGAPLITFEQMKTAADYVYRLCWVTNQLNTQVIVTGPQAALVLARYNANF